MIWLISFSLFIAFIFYLDRSLKHKLASRGLYLIEFPKVSPQVLEKFKSFDPELGWEPKENSFNKDNMGTYTGLPSNNHYTIDAYGSRLLPYQFPRGLVSTYGDSFCLCREVSDENTFQAFLSKKLQSYVSNYGVGNFGMDQAILRLEKRYPQDPTKHIILAITPWTIERIISVWKHYSEPGNILAAKPRFTLEDNQLKYIPNFIQNKAEFANLCRYKDFLHQYDGNYPYFCQEFAKQPSSALWHFIQNKNLMNFVLKRSLYDVACTQKNSTHEAKKIEFLKAAKLYVQETSRQKTRYLENLFKEHSSLFITLLEKFVAFASIQNAKAYILMLPSYEHVKFIQEGGDIYQNSLDLAQEKLTSTPIIDMYSYWKDLSLKDLDSMYVDTFGHHSVKGNEFIAEVLHKSLQL